MLKRIAFVLALAMASSAFAAAEAWNNVSMIDTQCSSKAKADPGRAHEATAR